MRRSLLYGLLLVRMRQMRRLADPLLRGFTPRRSCIVDERDDAETYIKSHTEPGRHFRQGPEGNARERSDVLRLIVVGGVQEKKKKKKKPGWARLTRSATVRPETTTGLPPPASFAYFRRTLDAFGTRPAGDSFGHENAKQNATKKHTNRKKVNMTDNRKSRQNSATTVYTVRCWETNRKWTERRSWKTRGEQYSD